MIGFLTSSTAAKIWVSLFHAAFVTCRMCLNLFLAIPLELVVLKSSSSLKIHVFIVWYKHLIVNSRMALVQMLRGSKMKVLAFEHFPKLAGATSVESIESVLVTASWMISFLKLSALWPLATTGSPKFVQRTTLLLFARLLVTRLCLFFF